MLTLDERTTRFRHIIKIPGRSTQAVEQGLKTLRELYGERFSQVFRSITSDNGSEFASLPQLLPTIPIYYAHPYSAYERGLNEKQNSLIRRFLPKGRSFDGVTDEQIREMQDWINQLPENLFITVRRRNYFRLSYLILQSRFYDNIASVVQNPCKHLLFLLFLFLHHLGCRLDVGARQGMIRAGTITHFSPLLTL